MFGTISSSPSRSNRRINRNSSGGNRIHPFLSSPPVTLREQQCAEKSGTETETSYLLAKRAIDIAGSLAGLVLLFPVLLLIAVLVRLDSRGPVFHRRRVVARQDCCCDSTDDLLTEVTTSVRTFDAFKFRTMRVDADEYLRERPDLWEEFQKNFKLESDPRVTRLGQWLRKTSLDELPQLVNILRGQMSLVGPRILTEEELCRYGEHRAALLSVMPGLTGLWQVSGRQDVSYEERVRLDMAYLEGRSIKLDVEILVRTVDCVLSRRGAY